MLGAQHLPVLPVPGLGKFNAATRRQRVGTAALGKRGGGHPAGTGLPPHPITTPPTNPARELIGFINPVSARAS